MNPKLMKRGPQRYLFITCTVSAIFICTYLLFSAVSQAARYSTLLKTYMTLPSLSSSCAAGNSKNLCILSLKESDGWFCESDDDWKQRKQIHRRQNKLNRHSDSRSVFFQNNWEPTFHCAFQQRIGSVGDGGKWVCDIYKLQTNTSSPLIYSFGSNGDFSFERTIKANLPNAEIHTFDQGIYTCPPGICFFHKATIGDGKGNGTKSLNMIIDKLGHRRRLIDILKMDIEGSEYAAWQEFFKHSQSKMTGIDNQQSDSEMPYIRQILIEIHMQHGTVQEPVGRLNELFESFRSNNYAIFHKEVNLANAANIFEYGFIRLNRVFFRAST